jgi:hypothetical protein
MYRNPVARGVFCVALLGGGILLLAASSPTWAEEGGALRAEASSQVAPSPLAEARLLLGDEGEKKGEKKDEASKSKKDLKPLEIKLPKPAFKGTPKHVPPGTRLEKPRKGPRPEFLAPEGSKLISLEKPVKASDSDPIIGSIDLITDGDKEANEGCYVELGPGLQYAQIDLKKKQKIDAVLVWHFHASARVYHDVVVQVCDDKDFITGVKTVFNNDHDNSAGLGIGEDLEYWETFEGKLIDAKGVEGRFLRLYSNGSTADDQNHYTEVEVYGRDS